MTDPGNSAPAPRDAQSIHEIVEVVLLVLDKKGREETAKKGILLRLADGIRAYWPLMAAIASAGIAITAWISLDVSPLESAREIAYKKQEREYRQQLTQLHLELGNDFLDVGQIQAAEVEFVRAREIDPNNIPAELGLLKVSIFEPIIGGEFEPELAQRRLRAILERAGEDSHVYAFLGNVYQGIDPEESERYYDRALQINPDNAWAYFGKGVLYDLQGRAADAAEMYTQASLRSEWNQTFLNNLAYQQYRLGNYEKALDYYIRLLRLDGRYLLSYYMLAKIQMQLGAMEAAYNNLLILEDLLDDQAILDLQRNKGTWYFHRRDKGVVRFYSPEEKSAYAQYLIALVALVSGRETESQTRLSKVLDAPVAHSARELIAFDIERLAEWKPDLKKRLASFSAAIKNQ